MNIYILFCPSLLVGLIVFFLCLWCLHIYFLYLIFLIIFWLFSWILSCWFIGDVWECVQIYTFGLFTVYCRKMCLWPQSFGILFVLFFVPFFPLLHFLSVEWKTCRQLWCQLQNFRKMYPWEVQPWAQPVQTFVLIFQEQFLSHLAPA